MRELMSNSENIRNIFIISQVDHGKSTLIDTLMLKVKIIEELEIKTPPYLEIRQDERDRIITTKSQDVSLFYEQCKENTEVQKYLINLINPSEDIYFNSEVTVALRVTDGALVVVDGVEGVGVQTETALRRALLERIRPALMINKFDRYLLELNLDAESIYQALFSIIDEVNSIISAYEYEYRDMSVFKIDPVKGNVVFGSGLMDWAFSLKTFAAVYSRKFGVDKEKIVEKLWGEWYFDKESKKWMNNNKSNTGKQLKRGFNEFIIEPLQKLFANIIEGNWERLEKMLPKLNIELNADEKLLEGKKLLKKIMQKWISSADCLLEMIVNHLPSPTESQRDRVEHLYEGPLDDDCATGIRNCDPNGPLVVYISKLIPIEQSYRFIAFGRVFSGTASTNQIVRIMGPNYLPGNKADLYEKRIQQIFIMMGKKPFSITDIPCGNIIGIAGIDPYLIKSGTLSTSLSPYPLKNMKYSIIPVVRVAVNPKYPSDLPKLIEGLKRLSKSDQIVRCYQETSGEHIIAGCGDLHVKNCLRDLIEICQIEVICSEPFVIYNETVQSPSLSVAMTKSPNKHNRLYVSAEPLAEGLSGMIENGLICSNKNIKDSTKLLQDCYKWDQNDAKKIWCFGPKDIGANFLVDQSKSINFINEIKDSMISGFQWATEVGPLCEENMRGVRFNIIDAYLHSDCIHRGGGQIIPSSRRAFYGAFLLANPTLQEPIFSAEIRCPSAAIEGVYKCLNSRRGIVISEERIKCSPIHLIKAYLPVSDSFGFTSELTETTSGYAFSQLIFDHWATIYESSIEPGTRVYDIIAQKRAAKGLNPNIPLVNSFVDKL